MRFRFAMIGMLCFSPAAFTASTAVEEVHYQMGADIGRTEFPGIDATGTSFVVRGGLTFPLGQYFGASASGGYNRTEISESSLSCDFSGTAFGADLFARAPEIGRIGAGYGRGSADFCTSGDTLGSSSGSIDTDTVSLNAEYYFEHFTVGVTRSRTEYDQGPPTTDRATADGSWYPTANARLSLFVAGLDAEDTYGARMEFQPQALGNSTSISASYASTDGSDSVTLGVTFFFDQRVNIKFRDRLYR